MNRFKINDPVKVNGKSGKIITTPAGNSKLYTVLFTDGRAKDVPEGEIKNA